MIEYTDEQHDSLIRGHRKQLADAQATVEALQRELGEARHTADVYQKLYGTTVMDRAIVNNEKADLQATLDAERERSKKQAEEAMVVFSKLSQLQALVRDFIEAWDHDGEPNAVAYEGVVARARATLDATTPAKGQELEDK